MSKLDIELRNARKEDIDSIIELVLRLKRLNEEFDPLLKVSNAARENIRQYIEEAIDSQRNVLIVAEQAGKIIGALKADIVDRIFYEPPKEGIIRELYVMPEHRRKGLGQRMIEQAIKQLRERGAGLITAEFPAQHKIAVAFYEQLGFRPITSIYARET